MTLASLDVGVLGNPSRRSTGCDATAAGWRSWLQFSLFSALVVGPSARARQQPVVAAAAVPRAPVSPERPRQAGRRRWRQRARCPAPGWRRRPVPDGLRGRQGGGAARAHAVAPPVQQHHRGPAEASAATPPGTSAAAPTRSSTTWGPSGGRTPPPRSPRQAVAAAGHVVALRGDRPRLQAADHRHHRDARLPPPAVGRRAQQLTALFDAGVKEKDFATGVEWFLTGVLQSPDFLYQFARPAARRAGRRRSGPSPATRWPAACPTSSGTRCPTTSCSRPPGRRTAWPTPPASRQQLDAHDAGSAALPARHRPASTRTGWPSRASASWPATTRPSPATLVTALGTSLLMSATELYADAGAQHRRRCSRESRTSSTAPCAPSTARGSGGRRVRGHRRCRARTATACSPTRR